MQKLKSLLLAIFSPSATKLGILITAGFTYVGWTYYNTPSEQMENNLLQRTLMTFHQKSVDWRLIARGEKSGSPDVALIVVDEESLEKLGRWPWPRNKIGEMIERLRSYGAASVGFDAVFAEPDNNGAIRTLSSLKDSGLASSEELQSFIELEMDKANTDLAFSRVVEKHSEGLVMGTYFDYSPYNLYPYQEICAAKIEMQQQEHKFLETDERPVVVLDEYGFELPPEVDAKLTTTLAKIEQDTRSQFPTPNNASEKFELEKSVQEALFGYCDRWLIDGKDEYLGELRGPASHFDPNSIMYSVLKNNIIRTGRWWTNIPLVAQGTKNTGFFNAFLDSDGSIRTATLILRHGSNYLSSLALKSVMVAKNYGLLVTMGPDPIDPSAKGIKEMAFTDPDTAEVVKKIPVDAHGRIAINYRGGRYTFPHLSVAELFNGKDTAKITKKENGRVETVEVSKADFIKNKVFLFGATATGIYDLRVTPFEENYPGLEIHANIVDNLMREDYLTKPHDEGPKMLATLLGVGTGLSFLISTVGALAGMLATVFILAALVFVDNQWLFSQGYVITIILPLFLVVTLYVTLTFYKYLTEERKKKELKGTFQKFVSPAVVEEILKDPTNVQLGGKKQHMSVMFSDVRGFTTISEKLDPEKLGDILNMYLTPMTRLVFETKGTLDKYMGDAIMAFWGAPIHFGDHAKKACDCALLMMKQLDELRKEFHAQGLPDIDIGIGINTGDMSVGNMGSDIVRSYTVMGDSVNLGSRLEGINKEYGTHVIISEFTHSEVKDDFICREIDWVRVKGKKLPVKIYELMGRKSDTHLVPKVEAFAKAFDLYHKKDWKQALAAFESVLAIDADDKPAQLYVKRCKAYEVEPPADNWDGVFEMKTK